MTQLCPDFYFGQLDKKQAMQLRDLARRVALACTVHGRGDDLLAYVYLAGLYHGSTISDKSEGEENGLGR